PVIFLHAFTGNTESWQHQLPVFRSAGYRCITYDRRGWGRTRTDQSGEQPGYITDDLQELVEHLHLERFYLVGTAGGGYGVLDYALTYPERLRCMVVACSGGGIQDPEYAEARK
ncbi:MAG: alpha/beta fold hydrolase, partial [Deltaproteobacteria bacterium]|nr:alpha/beta fold hydrolase [Deltaproteobacteria bacterium]